MTSMGISSLASWGLGISESWSLAAVYAPNDESRPPLGPSGTSSQDRIPKASWENGKQVLGLLLPSCVIWGRLLPISKL